MNGKDSSDACRRLWAGKPQHAGVRKYATRHFHLVQPWGRSFLILVLVVLTGCQQASQHSNTSAHPPTSAHTPATSPAYQVQGGAEVSQQPGSWPTFGDNPDSSQGAIRGNPLSAATVSQLSHGWTVALPDLADERPILVRNVTWPDGTVRDVLYLTTDKGTLLALDAVTGVQLWATTPKPTSPKYTRASPAADPLSGLIYSYGLDGKVHRFRLATGQEVLGNGWPVQVTLMPVSEKISSALNLANGYLYVTTASFSGDAPPYQGHMVAINVKTGATHVFNSLCNDHTHLLALDECSKFGGGIWGRPGVAVDPVTGHIFFAISDGPFTANTGGAYWGDTVVEMTPDGSRVLDSYTPENYLSEGYRNRDLGSVAPVLLPRIPQSRTPELAVQAGKEGLLRLLNRQNLSGQGGPAHVGGELQTISVPHGCPVMAQPVDWIDPATGILWLFVADTCHLDGYKVQTSIVGVTSLQLAWSVTALASSPIVAAGVLFAATSHALLALDPNTGHLLWSSVLATAGGGIGAIHWESPIVVGDRVYITDNSRRLTMYQLPG